MTLTAKQFWNTNVGKTLKAAAWSGASMALSYVITAISNETDLFGPLTLFINAALVFVQKTYFSNSTPNL